MSVTGLCAVCERREAEFVCGRCGAVACEAHYERAAGVCTSCASETGRGEGGGEGDPDREHRL
jgi:hypothetical protein